MFKKQKSKHFDLITTQLLSVSIFKYSSFFTYTYILFIVAQFSEKSITIHGLIVSLIFSGSFFGSLLWTKLIVTYKGSLLYSQFIVFVCSVLSYFFVVGDNYILFTVTMFVCMFFTSISTQSFLALIHNYCQEHEKVENRLHTVTEIGYILCLIVGLIVSNIVNPSVFLFIDAFLSIVFLIFVYKVLYSTPYTQVLKGIQKEHRKKGSRLFVFLFVVVFVSLVLYEQNDWLSAFIYEEQYTVYDYSIFLILSSICGIVVTYILSVRDICSVRCQFIIGIFFTSVSTILILIFPNTFMIVLFRGLGMAMLLSSIRPYLMFYVSKHRSIEFTSTIHNALQFLSPTFVGLFLSFSTFVYCVVISMLFILSAIIVFYQRKLVV